MNKKRRNYIVFYSILAAVFVISLVIFIIAMYANRNGINTNTYFTFRFKRILFILIFASFAAFVISVMRQLLIKCSNEVSGPLSGWISIISIIIATLFICLVLLGSAIFLYFRLGIDAKEFFVTDSDNGKKYCAVQTGRTICDDFEYEYRYDYFEYKFNGLTYKLTETPYYIYADEDFNLFDLRHFVPDDKQNGMLIFYKDGKLTATKSRDQKNKENNIKLQKELEKKRKKEEEEKNKRKERYNDIEIEEKNDKEYKKEIEVIDLGDNKELPYFAAVKSYLITKGELADKKDQTEFEFEINAKNEPIATVLKEEEKDGDKSRVTEHILKFYKYEDDGKICKILYSTLDYTLAPDSVGYTPTETMITFFEVNTETLEVTDTESIEW